MRVISGKLKGRSIETINDHSTRPTSDKVKESLFNIIGPYFSSGKVLDLFAGSGGLGIEAISRGADHAIFVDQQRRVVQIIKKNLASLNITEQAEVYQNDAFRALKALGKRKVKFNYIFIDPPYNKNVYQLLMEEIVKQNIISNDTIIVCEHDQKLNLADQIALFKKTRTEKYGSSIAISFYKRKDEENE